MDDYRNRQRLRWSGNPILEGRTVTPPPADSDNPSSHLTKVHVLPVGDSVSESERVDSTISFLREYMKSSSNSNLLAGTCFTDSSMRKFVVVKVEPDSGGPVSSNTEFFVNGPPVTVLTKLQLVALLDPISTETEEDVSSESEADSIFRRVLSPYLQEKISKDGSLVLPLFPNQSITVGIDRFVATAMDPQPAAEGLALVDINTLTYIDVERSGDFSRIHVLPFHDTLPRVYDFDVFEDYLKPFFLINPISLFGINTQFVFHGVQFKVVSADPSDGRPRRIGPNTVIHCEGVLHATLRNMLPPELLEQLSTLPPGLQMLLINTELLASADVLDRFIDLQESLASRRGLSSEILDSLPTDTYKSPPPGTDMERPESATQCMICLADFVDGDTLRRLPCTHVFHQPCIDEWLLHRSTSCCLCKTEVDPALRRST